MSPWTRFGCNGDAVKIPDWEPPSYDWANNQGMWSASGQSHICGNYSQSKSSPPNPQRCQAPVYWPLGLPLLHVFLGKKNVSCEGKNSYSMHFLANLASYVCIMIVFRYFLPFNNCDNFLQMMPTKTYTDLGAGKERWREEPEHLSWFTAIL